MALTEKQARFVAEYLVDLNATEAAKRAGYSEKTAYSIGFENLRKPEIQDALQKAMADRAKRTEISQDRVLKELAAIGFAKATDYVQIRDGCVHLTETDALAEEQRRAISSIKEGKFGVELRLHDKLRALQMIGEHIGMFTGKEAERDDIEDDGLMSALDKLAGNLFDDGDDSAMLPKEKDK